MKKRALAAVTIIAMVGLLAPACGTPVPETVQPNYSSAACGLSIWYPEDWIYEEGIDEVFFSTPAEISAPTENPLQSGAFMLVVCGGMEDEFGFRVATIVSMLGLEAVTHEARTIGGQEGYVETVEFGTEDGEGIVGFIAGAGDEEWGYFFVAAGAEDEWTAYEPVLMTILDSVRFTAPARPTPAQTG
jgi:hypothetical protein